MQSYGLKTYNHEDYETAHEIIDQIKKSDWEEIQQQKNSK
jgi:hypothetical protein